MSDDEDARRLAALEYIRDGLNREPPPPFWDDAAFDLRRLVGDEVREDEMAARVRLVEDNEQRAAILAEQSKGDTPDVPPAEWISSPYYRGDVEVWPKVADLFVEVVEGNYNLIVLKGAAGWAKTFLSRLLLLYTIHQVGNRKDPHRALGPMSRAIPLRIPLVHINKDRAREELLDPLVTMIQSAGWFKDHFPPQKRVFGDGGDESTFLAFRKHGRVMLRIRPVATRVEHIVGNDMVAAHLSECNRYESVTGSKRSRGDETTYDAADTIVREMKVRLLTRFDKPLSPMIRMVLDSSERYDDDFLSRFVPTLGDSELRHIVVQKANWETVPGADAGERFKFAKPRKGARSEVVQDDERAQQLAADGREIVDVPAGRAGEYLAAALRDPDEFSRSVAGWPTDAIKPWLRNTDALTACRDQRRRFLAAQVERERQAADNDPTGLYAQLPAQVVLDGAEGAPERFLTGYNEIDWSALTYRKQEAGGIMLAPQPRILPHRSRFIHVDLADTGDDFVGFAMGCVAADRSDGPVIWYDLKMRIEKAAGREHDIDAIRQLIEDLRDKGGFSIELVTFDRYQSSHIIQILRDRGFTTERISLHRTSEGYDALKAALQSGRVLVDCGETVETELSQLEERTLNNRRTINHRRGGHDDMSDSLAGVCWQASLFVQQATGRLLGAELPTPIAVEADDDRPDWMEGVQGAVPDDVQAREQSRAIAQREADVQAFQRDLARQKREKERWAAMARGDLHPDDYADGGDGYDDSGW